MPYAAGVYSLPPGTAATSLSPIDSSDYNAFIADIEAAQNAARPITAGGTGAQTAALARVALGLEIGVNVQAYSADLSSLVTAWVPASASGPASLDFAEDTDNGTNRVRMIAPATLAADTTLTLPSSTGTVAVTDAPQTFSAVQTFSAIPVLSAGGIKFPGTQVPSADVNTLDDYEEGTFTPAFSSTGATFSYALQTGSYTKIGNRVLVDFRIQLNGSGNTLTANALSITGLPFSHAAGFPTVIALNWSNFATSIIQALGLLSSSSTTITMCGNTAAATSVQGINSNALSPTLGTIVTGQFQYQV